MVLGKPLNFDMNYLFEILVKKGYSIDRHFTRDGAGLSNFTTGDILVPHSNKYLNDLNKIRIHLFPTEILLVYNYDNVAQIVSCKSILELEGSLASVGVVPHFV